jgi:hypothetical protein
MKIIIVDKKTNVVINVAAGDKVDGEPSANLLYEIVDDSFYVGPGFTKNEDGSYSPPYREPDPIDVPRSITRRQCAIELRERNLITPQEALDMTRTGIPPAMVQKIFSSMSETDQLIAETDFAADTYLRSNPLLIFIMSASGASEEDIDQFFISASIR